MARDIHGFPFTYLLQRELERKAAEAEALGEVYGVRTLARALAEDWPTGATAENVETERRALRKYLYSDVEPTRAKKRRIAVALGLDADFFFQPTPGYERALRERHAVIA